VGKFETVIIPVLPHLERRRYRNAIGINININLTFSTLGERNFINLLAYFRNKTTGLITYHGGLVL
jgi:hypothetical protein